MACNPGRSALHSGTADSTLCVVQATAWAAPWQACVPSTLPGPRLDAWVMSGMGTSFPSLRSPLRPPGLVSNALCFTSHACILSQKRGYLS